MFFRKNTISKKEEIKQTYFYFLKIWSVQICLTSSKKTDSETENTDGVLEYLISLQF